MNEQLKKMVKRTFHVRWWVKYLFIVNNIIPGGKQHTAKCPREIQGSRDINGLLYKTKELREAYLSFSEEEHTEANFFLKDIGLEENDKFVCLCVRDPSYRRQVNPDMNFDYHNLF